MQTHKTVPWRHLLFKRISKQIRSGSIKKIQKTISIYNIDVSSFENSAGYSLLHVAAQYNRPQIARLLIAQGCSIHKQDMHGRCALYVAALYNAKKVINEMDK